MTDFAVLLPIGPGEHEIARAADTLESLYAYEPEGATCVLIDDAPAPRNLAEHLPCPTTWRLVSLPSPSQGRPHQPLVGLCAGVLSGLAWIHAHAHGRFVLKLDTDTLVIAPFAERLAAAFEAMPEVGMLGAYDRSCTGIPRDVRLKAIYVRKLAARVSFWPRPFRRGRFIRVALTGGAARVRQRIRAALAQGYRPGEHCLGAAYALAWETVERFAAAGYFEDLVMWLGTHGEDVLVSMHVRAVGLHLHGLVAPDEPFGIKWRGLPDTPERLAAQGYAFIHSVKNDPALTEADIRAFFRARRPSQVLARASQHAMRRFKSASSGA